MRHNNEAIAIVKRMVADGCITQDIAEKYFPELAESEDEKTRKSLLGFCKTAATGQTNILAEGIDFNKCVVWLEKQGEQKPVDIEIPFGAKDSKLIEETYHIPDGYHAEIDSNTVVIKKGEPKPVEWSEKDETMLNHCMTIVDTFFIRGHRLSNTEVTEVSILSWLKSLKDRCLPQPKQEWSEEDKEMLSACIRIFERISDGDLIKGNKDDANKYISFLKSLRPQNRLKPVKQQ